MANILIIDDDRVFCDVLSRTISQAGHKSAFCLRLKEGIGDASSSDYDLVLLDVQLPDGNGLQAIEALKRSESSPEVIIITGFGNPDGAELAIRWGAWDYLEKPTSLERITLSISRALEYRKEKLAKSRSVVLDRKRIIGESPAIRACLDRLAQASRTDVTVLITGETGSGKELFARTLHENSPRSAHPFIVVDCSALPESLVESLLFGHEKGAFTGAERAQTGLVKLADGGTLFLDEVGELSISVQKSFLRVLQEQTFRPVGSKREEASNFRLVAATNRDLDAMVRSGGFRSDLLFRLRSFVIDLPLLRERREDIKALAMHFIAKACEKSRTAIKGFSPDFFDVLESYDWPGNIRELFLALQSALASGFSESVLYPVHLPIPVRAAAARSSLVEKHGSICVDQIAHLQMEPHPQCFKEFRIRLMEAGEQEYFTRIASIAMGNPQDACRLSGLSKSRLYYFLQKHGISLSRYASPAPSGPESQE